MQFKDFEIRPVESIDGAVDPNRFELVKWYDHEPQGVTNLRTGKWKTVPAAALLWHGWNGTLKSHALNLHL